MSGIPTRPRRGEAFGTVGRDGRITVNENWQRYFDDLNKALLEFVGTLAQLEGNLDDIDDGVTYARPVAEALTAGQVDLSRPGVIERHLDSIADSPTYGRTRLTALNDGRVDMEAVGVINRVADNITETLARRWAAESGATVGAVFGTNLQGPLGLVNGLDEVPEGTTFRRVRGTSLTGGEVDLALSGVLNRVAANIAEDSSRKWAAESGATIGARFGVNLKTSGGSPVDGMDEVPEGTVYQKVRATALTAGDVDLAKAGVVGKNLGNIADDATWGRTKLTALTSGEVDLSKAGVINRTADNIAEGTTRKWAAESGAQVVTGKSLDILADGTTYKRVAASTMDGNEVKSLKLPDTRDDNELPSWYRSNYPRREVTEFKTRSVVGVPGSAAFVSLLTKIPWADTTGGVVVQEVNGNDGFYVRKGAADDGSWGSWQKSYDELNKPALDADVNDGTTYKRVKATSLTSGEVDLSLSGVLNRTAANIAETGPRKWAAESGADVTAGKSINVIADVKTEAQFFTFTQTIMSGSGTVTIPTGAKLLVMRGWGGGGSGRKGGGAGTATGGGGGGGAAKKTVLIRSTDHGQTISYSVGPGGAGHTTNNTGGTAGTVTTIDSTGLSFGTINIDCNGGGAGTNAVGGAGGTATGGDTNVTGSAGTFANPGNGFGGNSGTIDNILGLGNNTGDGGSPGAGGRGLAAAGTSGAGASGMVTFTWSG